MTRTLATAAALALLLAGCSNEPNPVPRAPAPQPPAASEPTPETSPAEAQTLTAAKDAAQRFYDRYGAGDFAGAWELYTAAAQKAVNQATFVAVEEACTPTGAAIEVVDGRLETPTRAIVVVKALAATAKRTIVYQDGRWRVAPTPAGLRLWKHRTAKKMIAYLRSVDECDKNRP